MSVVCLAGSAVVFSVWFWREIGSFFDVAGNFYYDRKKKDTVVCLAGARSLLRPEKNTVICLLDVWFWRLQLEKINDTVI